MMDSGTLFYSAWRRHNAFVLFVFIPSFITADILCPKSKTTCPEDKKCCEVDGEYSCCDSDVDLEEPAKVNTGVEYVAVESRTPVAVIIAVESRTAVAVVVAVESCRDAARMSATNQDTTVVDRGVVNKDPQWPKQNLHQLRSHNLSRVFCLTLDGCKRLYVLETLRKVHLQWKTEDPEYVLILGTIIVVENI
ncbi:unnamed protein product [Larinioides sclopetarius]|uniref:Uncharacterized protein n=1 Tax=Larinioides sclopetarius TaxID=280406 RepID=A0AAV2B310_9ARAC